MISIYLLEVEFAFTTSTITIEPSFSCFSILLEYYFWIDFSNTNHGFIMWKKQTSLLFASRFLYNGSTSYSEWRYEDE